MTKTLPDPEKAASRATPGGSWIADIQLPPRRRLSTCTTVAEQLNPPEVAVELHQWPGRNAMMVSVVPPLRPEENIPHVPCDIVLVIDVSGSMGAQAPPPTVDSHPESAGMTVLDLTKHAARTIIETLDAKDRLGVVTFSTDVKIVFKLSFMTKEMKVKVLAGIEALRPEQATNLWYGLRDGLRLLRDAPSVPKNVGALYVLTDGQPNHMCPHQGYVAKLSQILRDQQAEKKQLPSIHTFGFGYSIRSGLLQAIAEVGAGTFSFIPDAGMIGTVFVHAVANLYTTFATQAKLTFRTVGSVKLYQDEGGKEGIELTDKSPSSREVFVNLGNLQYGQSRDIFLRYEDLIGSPRLVQAKVTYQFRGSIKSALSDECVSSDTTYLPSHVCDYHYSRAQICAFLRSLSVRRGDKEYVALPVQDLPRLQAELQVLISKLKSLGNTDEQNASLLQDLDGEDPHGQVRIALENEAHYKRWGQHYLLSLLNAHTYQICNSFKDSGPLQYGKNSPLFCSCRRELDDCFDNLPAPKLQWNRVRPPIFSALPSQKMHVVSMSWYNKSSNACFAGHCDIRLPNGSGRVVVQDLRAGMEVWTPRGPRRVVAVLRTAVHKIVLCGIGSLWITPWHPIQDDGNWRFPCEVSNESKIFTGTIYSILLEPSPDPDAHAIMVGGHVCVSLGHGITAGNDARAHKFFGSYRRVVTSLNLLSRDSNGVLRCSGMKRHPKSGLVCGFVGRRLVRKPKSQRPFLNRMKPSAARRTRIQALDPGTPREALP